MCGVAAFDISQRDAIALIKIIINCCRPTLSSSFCLSQLGGIDQLFSNLSLKIFKTLITLRTFLQEIFFLFFSSTLIFSEANTRPLQSCIVRNLNYTDSCLLKHGKNNKKLGFSTGYRRFSFVRFVYLGFLRASEKSSSVRRRRSSCGWFSFACVALLGVNIFPSQNQPIFMCSSFSSIHYSLIELSIEANVFRAQWRRKENGSCLKLRGSERSIFWPHRLAWSHSVD